MVSNLFFYQLALIALLWLWLLLHYAWPSDRAALRPTPPELTPPRRKRHRGMLKKVPVDGQHDTLDGEGRGLQPGGVHVVSRLAGSALAQAQDIGDHAGAFLGEGLGGQADGAQEIRLLRELLAQAWVLLVQRVMARHQGQNTARFQRVQGLGEKEVMQGQARPVVVQRRSANGTLPMTASMRPSGRRVSRKFSMRISWRGGARGRCVRRGDPVPRR